MATIRVSVDDTGALAAIHAWLQKIDPRDAMPLIAAAGESITRRRISAGGPDPDGRPWAPWSPGYQGGAGILQKDGYLLSSITTRLGADFAEWGSAKKYAAVHQDGATIKPKKPGGFLSWVHRGRRIFARQVTIPARPYLGFGAEEQQASLDALQAWFNGISAPVRAR